MTSTTRKLTSAMLASVVVFSGVLAGCSSNNSNSDGTQQTTEEAVFEAKEVEPIKTTNVGEVVVDEGYNVSYELQGTGPNPDTGTGSIVYVLLKNFNEMPLPADAIPEPTLTIDGEKIDAVSDGSILLDMPLGPKPAATNLAFAYDTSQNSLSDAEFTIGNVTFDGDLTSTAS